MTRAAAPSPQRARAMHPLAIVSASLAPVFFIGGTIVAELAWPGFDPINQTISELAAGDAPTRIFMTAMFVLTGLCHVVTASFVPAIGLLGRFALGIAGLALLAVAAFPLPTVATGSAAHYYSAMIGFIALAAWPLLGMRRDRDAPWLLRPLGATLGTLLLGALCTAFALLEATDGPSIGLSERVAANTESVWPLLVVLALLRRPAHRLTS